MIKIQKPMYPVVSVNTETGYSLILGYLEYDNQESKYAFNDNGLDITGSAKSTIANKLDELNEVKG